MGHLGMATNTLQLMYIPKVITQTPLDGRDDLAFIMTIPCAEQRLTVCYRTCQISRVASRRTRQIPNLDFNRTPLDLFRDVF